MTKEQQQKLDATLSNLQKKYGKGSISVFGKNQIKVERFPVSSMNLTEMMGGGFPRGRMIEIYGPESSGKTTLAEYFGGQCQNYYFEDKQRNGVVAYIDVEHALDPVYAESIGLKMKDVIFSQPDSAEQALDIVNDLLLSDVVDLIVVDSVAALVPQAEADGEITLKPCVSRTLGKKPQKPIRGINMKKMKSTLPSFAESISNGRIEELEDLMCTHYDEFLTIFHLLKDSVDDIARLEYKEKSDGKLTINVHTITIKQAEDIKKSATKILKEIEDSACDGEISAMANIVKIKLTKK